MNRGLMLIDVQEDFTRGALRNEEAIAALPTVKAVLDYARENDFYVWYTRDEHMSEREYMKSQEGKNLPIPHCIFDTPGWEFCKEVEPNEFEKEFKVIPKDHFGTFDWMDYPLEELDEIWLVGFCTDICVSANFQILKAMFPEVPIVIVADACAGVTPELHDAALKVMQSCQGKVMTWAEIKERENG